MKLKRFGAMCLSLALALSLTVIPSHAALEFSDVPEDFWGGQGYRDIKSMADKGLAKGYEDGTFRPNAAITRAEFASMAAGFMDESITDDGTGDFSRSRKDSFFWYKKVIESNGEDLD